MVISSRANACRHYHKSKAASVLARSPELIVGAHALALDKVLQAFESRRVRGLGEVWDTWRQQ